MISVKYHSYLCFIFLACAYLSKRACILQGDTASGKSFLVRLFADMLGKNLFILDFFKMRVSESI